MVFRKGKSYIGNHCPDIDSLEIINEMEEIKDRLETNPIKIPRVKVDNNYSIDRYGDGSSACRFNRTKTIINNHEGKAIMTKVQRLGRFREQAKEEIVENEYIGMFSHLENSSGLKIDYTDEYDTNQRVVLYPFKEFNSF